MSCGGNGGSSPLEDLVNEAVKADESMESYRASISIYIENSRWGNVKLEDVALDVNNNDNHYVMTAYNPETGKGGVIQDIVRVAGGQYSKDMQSGQWKEEEFSSMEVTSTQISMLENLPSVAAASEILGEEEVDGVTTTHLCFQIDPEDVAGILSGVEQSQLDANQGAQLDVWLDKEYSYMVKVEIVVRNMFVSQEIGYFDNRTVVNIYDIDMPIEIEPPI